MSHYLASSILQWLNFGLGLMQMHEMGIVWWMEQSPVDWGSE
ncbi:hypothetical protein [Providencia rettgeri]|nr:hypothetical protein [Providencia rettgeri]